ncbi:MAG: methyltransferase domain-containing protein [Candidatus Caldarchaeum sp.]|nr:methyltransferase domain-containing protein [Candidatus Caldarchaeum sp.]
MMEPYEPREDTFLTINCVLDYEVGFVAEVGCGPGHVLKALLEKAGEAVGTDIDWTSLEHAKRNLSSDYGRVHLVNSSTLPFRKACFDAVVSNPPYLPSDDEFFDPAIHGGPSGVETGLKIIDAAAEVLKPKGRLFLTNSSLGDTLRLLERAAEKGFKLEKEVELNSFFETVFCFIFSLEAD